MPVSGATRQTALSVSRSEARTSDTALAERRLHERDEVRRDRVGLDLRLVLGVAARDQREVGGALASPT